MDKSNFEDDLTKLELNPSKKGSGLTYLGIFAILLVVMFIFIVTANITGVAIATLLGIGATAVS